MVTIKTVNCKQNKTPSELSCGQENIRTYTRTRTLIVLHLIISTYEYRGLRMRSSPAAVEYCETWMQFSIILSLEGFTNQSYEASDKLHELLALEQVPFALRASRGYHGNFHSQGMKLSSTSNNSLCSRGFSTFHFQLPNWSKDEIEWKALFR